MSYNTEIGDEPVDIVSPDNSQETDFTFTPESSSGSIVQEEAVEKEEVKEVIEDVIIPESTDEIITTDEVEYEYEEIEDSEYVEFDEDLVLNYLKDKKGLKIENIDELLTPKEQKKYAPELEKFQEFIEKTGNNKWEDFSATQKDWTAETPENILREYIKANNPDLTQKQVDFLYEEKYSIEDLDEDDDERIILRKEIDTKTDLRNATKFLEERKAEFMATGGSDEHIPVEYREAKKHIENQNRIQEENEVIYTQEREKYISHIEKTYSDDFNGIKIKLGNKDIGFEDVFIKPDNMKETRDYISDADNFNKRFFEDGVLKDHDGFKNALIKEKNYERDLNIAFNLGYAKKVEMDDKLSKNIQPDNIREISKNKDSGFTFTAEK